MDRIPSEQIRAAPIITTFYPNVRSEKMREKLSTHILRTLDEL